MSVIVGVPFSFWTKFEEPNSVRFSRILFANRNVHSSLKKFGLDFVYKVYEFRVQSEERGLWDSCV
uniref:Uncharacterized protein n=1 Tax=Rhizophora mucronata TaxID=61149 RepID=A0A2P2IKH3_RHIMU